MRKEERRKLALREPHDKHGRFEKEGYRHMSEERREHEGYEPRHERMEERRVHEVERMDGRQPAGRRLKGAFGRELNMGIPSYDGELNYEDGAPMRNKFSWMQMSQEETLRAVKGRGTSFNEELMDQRETRYSERDRRNV
jgi:hypothetical protein